MLLSVQGFASGDCTRDAQAIRVFLEDGHLMGCSQSYAKNMGLYGQRIGCFSLITDSPKEAKAVESQMKVRKAPVKGAPRTCSCLESCRFCAQSAPIGRPRLDPAHSTAVLVHCATAPRGFPG